MAKGKGLPKVTGLGGVNGKTPGSRTTAAKINGGSGGQKNIAQPGPTQSSKIKKVK